MTTPRTFTFHHSELGKTDLEVTIPCLWPKSQLSSLATQLILHQPIGPLTGLISPSNVVQFRGIPYASIPGRFKRSVPLTSLPGTSRDFTEYGPACPQTFPSNETGGGPVPDSPDAVSDELACLNLQINVPLPALQDLENASSPKKLPLLIYIHGGGFVLGRIDSAHNTSHLVAQSLTDATPLISASIQYRLGALGYLHVPLPESSNRALWDQRNGLIWLQRFVGGFGGDAKRTTVFGESAGAMSICMHMMSTTGPSGALFQKAVLMSGVPGPMTGPVVSREAESGFEIVLAKMGVEGRGEEAVRKLSEVRIDTLVAVTEEMNADGYMWLSVQDEDWFGEEAGKVSWDCVPELVGRCEWVEEVVLGTTGQEGAMFMPRAAGITPSAWLASIEKQLGPQSAAMLGKAYSVTPDMDQNLFTTRFLQWIGDVIFDAPTHALATHLTTHTTKKVYRYIFAIRSPFPLSPFHGTAHHWVDIYFVFKTFLFRLPTQQLRNISTRHAQLWINFAVGMEPWAEYKITGKEEGREVIMLADERDGWMERSVWEDERVREEGWGRREVLWESWRDMRGRRFRPLGIEVLEGRRLT